MLQFLNFIQFYFEVAFYMFRTVFPSIIRSLRLYIQYRVYVKEVQRILASNQSLVQCVLHAVITVKGLQFNCLTPNDSYMGRTAPLTPKRCILYIYSTNISIEDFKHALYSPFFFSSKCSLFHNANQFGSCIIHILYTECDKIKKIIPAPKG